MFVNAQLTTGYVHPALGRAGQLADPTGLGVDPDGDLVDLGNRAEITGNIRPAEGVPHSVLCHPVR